MSNIRKSFNFRNGLQVDDTKFIINANGLVGIGSTIPTQSLDVGENVKVHGTIETEYLTVNNTTTIPTTNSNRINVGVTSITSGIITATSSSGIITYYGDGGNLINLPTSQWVDVDPGFGYTSIYSTGFVGVGTVDPRFVFQVAGNTDTSVEGFTGVGIQTGGHILAAGIVTAYSFSGFGTNITGINASNISNGTLNNSRLAETIESSQLNLTGIATAYSFSGFGTNITGINASNISNGTVSNSRLPSDIEVSNINLTGIITAYSFSGFGTDITGINASNISNGTLSNSRLASTVTVDNVVSTFTGDLIGTATTASSLSGTPNIEVGIVTASNVTASNVTASKLSVSGIVTASEFNVGTGGTIVNITSDGRVAIGSDTPTRPFEIITTGTSEIELVGTESRIILAEEKSGISISSNAAEVRYGNSNNAFELVNYAPGDFNFYLHAGGPGINTGRFAWVYGQDFSEKMSLTYGGLLGIGITNPSNTLHVVGTSTVTGNSFVGGDLTVSGNINGSITIADILTSNINVTSGISTFNIINPTQFGIGTNAPIVDVDARSSVALFSSVGIGTDDIGQADLRVPNGFAEFTSVGIGTTQSYNVPDDGNSGDLQLHNKSMTVFNGSVLVDDSPISSIGFGTFIPRSILDFGRVGAAASTGFMILPTLDSTQRVGLAYTVEGAIIYNSTTKKHQGYGSIDGGTTFGWQDLY